MDRTSVYQEKTYGSGNWDGLKRVCDFAHEVYACDKSQFVRIGREGQRKRSGSMVKIPHAVRIFAPSHSQSAN